MIENFRPIDLYNAYPDSDLLSVDPPSESETWDEFLPRAEGAGDTLFLFIAREVSDCEDDSHEIYRRLVTAEGQLETIAISVFRRRFGG